MKYANMVHNGLSPDKGDRVINLGDAFELIAVDRLYEQMKIPAREQTRVNLYELETYQGEEIILPVNFMLMPQIFNKNMLKMSSKIVPVFLGLTITDVVLSDEQFAFLKKWEPIGCRDERSKRILCERGIKAYLGGCLVATINRRSEAEDTDRKAAFIDVPKFVEPYIPEEIRDNMEILEHEFFCSYDEVRRDPSFKKKAEERISYYEKHISMIVTSRFHGAVIGMALKIPVILIAENNFYKFSWVSKLLPFYDRSNVSEINWYPKPVEIEDIKKQMTDIAKIRIQNAYIENFAAKQLEKRLCNQDRDDRNALTYVTSAKCHINRNWSREGDIKYAFWGINDNAAELYAYISKYYPKAILTSIYDGFRERKMAGLTSKVPTKNSIEMDTFIFVTSNTAGKPAKKLFEEMGKTNYFLCSLEFLRK